MARIGVPICQIEIISQNSNSTSHFEGRFDPLRFDTLRGRILNSVCHHSQAFDGNLAIKNCPSVTFFYFFYFIQRFITRGARADRGNYLVATVH